MRRTRLSASLGPTKEEAANIAPLLARLASISTETYNRSYLLSTTATIDPAAILEAATAFDPSVDLIHRSVEERTGGLATAVKWLA